MVGEFNLTEGQQIKIVVGQRGAACSNGSCTDIDSCGGGGGGSFVVKKNDNTTEGIYVIAGGGGGNNGNITNVIANASTAKSGNPGGNQQVLGGTGGMEELL